MQNCLEKHSNHSLFVLPKGTGRPEQVGPQHFQRGQVLAQPAAHLHHVRHIPGVYSWNAEFPAASSSISIPNSSLLLCLAQPALTLSWVFVLCSHRSGIC